MIFIISIRFLEKMLIDMNNTQKTACPSLENDGMQTMCFSLESSILQYIILLRLASQVTWKVLTFWDDTRKIVLQSQHFNGLTNYPCKHYKLFNTEERNM